VYSSRSAWGNAGSLANAQPFVRTQPVLTREREEYKRAELSQVQLHFLRVPQYSLTSSASITHRNNFRGDLACFVRGLRLSLLASSSSSPLTPTIGRNGLAPSATESGAKAASWTGSAPRGRARSGARPSPRVIPGLRSARAASSSPIASWTR